MHKYFPILAVSVIFSACAAGPVVQQPASYPFQHQAFDLKVGWQAVPAGQDLVVKGVVQNVRYPRVRDLDITVTLLDREKMIIAKGRSFTSPVILDQNDTGSFSVKLPNAAISKGNLLQFVILYLAIEDSDQKPFTWLNSFVVDATTGAPLQDNF